jgi:WD40 repeat protein
VFVLSPHSAGSRECRRELDYALELNKRILPVRIAETPVEALPPRLAEYQFIPSRALFGADFASSTQQLITEIEIDRDWVREHTDWSEKATEWDRHDRNRSYLLAGVELRNAESWRSRAAGKRPGLSTLQSQFIDASRQHATSRLRRTRGAVSVALAVAIGLAALALVLRQQAVSESHTARSGQLAAESLQQLSSDPQLALKLAVASATVKHTGNALAALRAVIPQNYMVREFSADGKPLLDAQWSTDGSMVVTVSRDNHAYVYSASSGRLLRRFPIGGLVTEPGGAFFVDHDDELLTWGPGSVRTWNLATGKRVLSLSDGTFTDLEDVVENPQGTMIATASGPQMIAGVELWSAVTGKRLHSLIRSSDTISNSAVPQQVAFSPNGELLAGGTQLGTALIWNARTGGFVNQLKLGDEHAYSTVTVAFSPDGRTLATGQSTLEQNNPGRTVLWHVPEWRSFRVIGGAEPVWSSDSAYVTTTTIGGDDLVWRLAALAHPWNRASGFNASGTLVTASAPNSGDLPGDLVIPSQDGFATVWDPYTGDVVERLAGDSGSVATAGFSPDGSKILTWSSDGTARIWDNGTITSTVAPHTSAASAVAKVAGAKDIGFGTLEPTELETAVRAYATDEDRPDNALVVFNPLTGRRLAAIRVGASLPDASFDGMGDLMLVTGVDVRSKAFSSSAEILRTHGGALVRAFPGSARSGELSPDGKLAAIISPNDDITIWSVASGRRLAVFRGDQSPSTGSDSHQIWVSFSHDGAYALSSDPEGRAFVWRSTTGRVVAEMKGDPEPPTGLWAGVSGAISPDDQLVVLARPWDDDAEVYRLGSSTPLLTLLGNPAGISNVVFSPDSQLIATLDDLSPEQINVYDTQSQQPLFTIPDVLAQAVSFSADSRSVLTDQRFPYTIYPCSICGGFDQLLSAARQRKIGHLTPQERYLYLR